MKIRSLYFAREAVSSLRMNLVQSIAAITTVALCLVTVGLILMVLFVGGQVIEKVEQKVEIEVFFDHAGQQTSGQEVDGVAQWGQIEQMGKTIRSWSEVKSIKYISKEKALAEFEANFKNNPEVIANLQGNPLPASYRIGLKDPRQVEAVAKRIKGLPYIRELVGDPNQNIKYGQDIAKRLFAATRWLSIVGGAFASLLIFVALVLITNTIRLAIFARRKEIGIMRLVGASNWFIRWPFIMEGMLQGLIGAFIAILLLTGLWRTVFADLASGEMLAFLSFSYDHSSFTKLVLLLAASGTLIGALGSLIALRRFLKT
jgi:cell division transport system permease protein